jgi:hypothetical protein
MEHLTASRRKIGSPDEDKGLRTFVDVAGELRAHDHRRIGAGAAVGVVGAEGAFGGVVLRAGATVVTAVALGGVEAGLAVHEVAQAPVAHIEVVLAAGLCGITCVRKRGNDDVRRQLTG